MPLTVFDIRGIPGNRRERIEAAVVAGCKHTSAPYEGWIAADPFKGGFRVLITGGNGFERTVTFAIDDDPSRNRRTRARDAGMTARRKAANSVLRGQTIVD